MLDSSAHRLAQYASPSVNGDSSRTYLGSSRAAIHQRPPWAVLRSPSCRAAVQTSSVPDVQPVGQSESGYRAAFLGEDQCTPGSARSSSTMQAATSRPQTEFSTDASVQHTASHLKYNAQFWTPEASPWSLFAEKKYPTSPFSAPMSLKIDPTPYRDPEWEAASVATEMALQVLQSDDFSDAPSSPLLEEASDDSAALDLTTPSSAGTYDIWDCHMPALPSPKPAGLCAPFEEMSVSRGSASMPYQGDDGQSQDKESDSDFPKKRGKARMSQEKRRRLARRKEREALAATQQSFHHLADSSQSWSPSPSMNIDPSRIRLSTSLPRAANCQTLSMPRSPAAARGSSPVASSSSSSYGDRADSDSGHIDLLKRAGAEGFYTGMQRVGSASSASNGPPYTPVTDSSSSMRSYSPWSAPSSHGAPLPVPREALDKVETLRALEQLTTQMLAVKQSNSSPLIPTLQETTRNTWRPAYSFTAGHAPATTEVTLPGRLPSHQTGPELGSSRGPWRSHYLPPSQYGRPSPAPAPAAQLPIPVPMSYEQAARTPRLDGRQEYGRSIGHQSLPQQRPRGPAVGVIAQVSTFGPNSGRSQGQRQPKTFLQRQQYGAPTPHQHSLDGSYGRWQSQQWPM